MGRAHRRDETILCDGERTTSTDANLDERRSTWSLYTFEERILVLSRRAKSDRIQYNTVQYSRIQYNFLSVVFVYS